MVLKHNYPTPAKIDISYIWKIKESEVNLLFIFHYRYLNFFFFYS